MEKPNVRFHDGQILSEEPLNKAMEAVDYAVEEAQKVPDAVNAASSAAESASQAASSAAAIEAALEAIKGSGDIPAATVAQVVENTADISQLALKVGDVLSEGTLAESSYITIPTIPIGTKVFLHIEDVIGYTSGWKPNAFLYNDTAGAAQKDNFGEFSGSATLSVTTTILDNRLRIVLPSGVSCTYSLCTGIADDLYILNNKTSVIPSISENVKNNTDDLVIVNSKIGSVYVDGIKTTSETITIPNLPVGSVVKLTVGNYAIKSGGKWKPNAYLFKESVGTSIKENFGELDPNHVYEITTSVEVDRLRFAISDADSVPIKFETKSLSETNKEFVESLDGVNKKLDNVVNIVYGEYKTDTFNDYQMNWNTGEKWYSTGSGWSVAESLKVKGGDTIVLKKDGVNANFRYSLFRYGSNFGERISGGSDVKELVVPSNAEYYEIRAAITDSNTAELTFKSTFSIAETASNENHRSVLWIGTSIPAGFYNQNDRTTTYPHLVCKKLGWTCYNNSLGESGIVKRSGTPNDGRAGKDLSESTAEKVARYKDHIGTGSDKVSQQTYDAMMNWGYDKLIIPYIDGTIASCDMIVFDHGFNDRNLSFANVIEHFNEYDFSLTKADSEFNRGTFVGAFCFLLKKIWSVNPNIKVVINSYLENLTSSPMYPNPYDPATEGGKIKDGYNICTCLKMLASKFNLPYLNMCDYNGFSMEYIPNTSTYLSTINAQQGTNYELKNYTGKPNTTGDVTRFQYYCPDGTHPHTDRTGRSINVIAESLAHLLKEL